jgi:hypothetical protein
MVRLLASFVAFILFISTAAAGQRVDVALVLAVDVSASINQERYELQRRGFEAAFRNDAVIEAVASGEHHAIAVTLVEWSGPNNQKQIIGWTLIDCANAARAFGAAIGESPRAFSDFTSISAAIDFSMQLVATSGFEPMRMVIDVSGDGANNSGGPVTVARDAAVAAGITVNGLAILGNEPGLDTYYRDNVIGGEGSFMIAAENFDAFSNAILNKLVREIAGPPMVPYSLAALGP